MVLYNDLRIGNYIRILNTIEWKTIDLLSKNFIKLNEDNSDNLYLTELEYIPLTIDILLLFGFKPFGKYTYYKGKFLIHNRIRGFIINKRLPIINTVNKLQNIYFEFTEKELIMLYE